MKCPICKQYLEDVDANSTRGLEHLSECQAKRITALEHAISEEHIMLQCLEPDCGVFSEHDMMMVCPNCDSDKVRSVYVVPTSIMDS